MNRIIFKTLKTSCLLYDIKIQDVVFSKICFSIGSLCFIIIHNSIVQRRHSETIDMTLESEVICKKLCAFGVKFKECIK